MKGNKAVYQYIFRNLAQDGYINHLEFEKMIEKI